ncbi:hypothetical protein IE81DRAFT_325965 [Ceraceosorus guamensis]|uniref:Uncharacterized protein n=1 Tax=Ceraceosorus guamensis TaxID=1522189 RepID=A0A316VX34_9BASI|nr:hypothetical protein IE81DRAFT_325965 [Ceraceosorus guamensis]PWN40035.1 hypothetical protein IE81DRAFT_325965 [Ceraceosorus guamensis]
MLVHRILLIGTLGLLAPLVSAAPAQGVDGVARANPKHSTRKYPQITKPWLLNYSAKAQHYAANIAAPPIVQARIDFAKGCNAVRTKLSMRSPGNVFYFDALRSRAAGENLLEASCALYAITWHGVRDAVDHTQEVADKLGWAVVGENPTEDDSQGESQLQVWQYSKHFEADSNAAARDVLETCADVAEAHGEGSWATLNIEVRYPIALSYSVNCDAYKVDDSLFETIDLTKLVGQRLHWTPVA